MSLDSATMTIFWNHYATARSRTAARKICSVSDFLTSFLVTPGGDISCADKSTGTRIDKSSISIQGLLPSSVSIAPPSGVLIK
jgi:hypothetical protein